MLNNCNIGMGASKRLTWLTLTNLQSIILVTHSFINEKHIYIQKEIHIHRHTLYMFCFLLPNFADVRFEIQSLTRVSFKMLWATFEKLQHKFQVLWLPYRFFKWCVRCPASLKLTFSIHKIKSEQQYPLNEQYPFCVSNKIRSQAGSEGIVQTLQCHNDFLWVVSKNSLM